MLTTGDLMADYYGSVSFKQLSQNTQKLYAYGLGAFADFFGGDMPLEEVTPRRAEQFYQHLCKKKSDNYARRLLAGPKAACNYYMAIHELSINPFGILSTNPHYDDREQLWTENQMETFIEAAKDSRECSYMAKYFDFLYVSAQRVFEQRLLRYEDLRVHPQNGKKYFPILQAKTRNRAPVWATDRLFRQFDHRIADIPESGYLFTKGGQPVCEHTIGSDFQMIRDNAGLPSELMLRDLRRTRASDLMATGKYAASQVMALTGHMDEKVFKRTYVVVKPEATDWMHEE